MTTNFFLFSLALGVATGALGSYIAEKKRKNPSFWICDRFFIWSYWSFGPIAYGQKTSKGRFY